MHCGIEFEYLLVDSAGPTLGRIRDFRNLPFAEIRALLEEKPGRNDTSLATGDLGIRSGYWYLEGDERFAEDGSFCGMAVKGVEIRTPPAPNVTQAIQSLLTIERQLSVVLAQGGLELAIVSFNPVCAGYHYDPPLNAWERHLRATDPEYADDAAHVTTLSYGPDINLSQPGWTLEQNVDAARKLNHYAPYLIPFSFSSPFYDGRIWTGYSKRTHERAGQRPAVKLFLDAQSTTALAASCCLIRPARLPAEIGRIEFKAFDAHPTLDILAACCHLLEGVCLADDLPERSEQTDVALYRRAAQAGFADDTIRAGASEVLTKARAALLRAGDLTAVAALAALEALLASQRTPAHALLERYRLTGVPYQPGGLADTANHRLAQRHSP